MLLKLAWRNIRHSVRDYTIYFLTLLFGVAVFYAFNSIGGQEIMFDLESRADERMFDTTQMFMNMFSGLIACVLGFLILYSNGFLIRRRKREFGTYMLLGMSAKDVSLIMLVETSLVGVASLALGLVVGFLISQGMSFLTASLFGATIKHYQFVFSMDAFVMTIVCFAVIYLVAAIFNTFSVNRHKLIDLLSANSSNQKVIVRNPGICVAVFAVAVALIAYAYQQLVESGMVNLDDPHFIRATICMLVGTLLFFWSLAGFTISVMTRAKGFYLKGLRPFTVRQISSRVNTAFLSLWAVCVMLFFSISTFSVGMGLVTALTGDIKAANPYSATLTAQVYESTTDYASRAEAMQAEAPERYARATEDDWDMAKPLMAASPELWAKTIGAWAQETFYYVPDMTYGQLLEGQGEKAQEALDELNSLSSRLADMHLEVLSIDDLNAALALQGKPAVDLEDGQYAVLNNMDMSEKVAGMLMDAAPAMDIAGTKLALMPELVEVQLEDNALTSTGLAFAVPDEQVSALKEAGEIPSRCMLNVMYADNGKTDPQNDAALEDILANAQPASMGGFEQGYAGSGDSWASLLWPVTRMITAQEMIAQAGGLRMMVTYLALYIGFVLLISTAAILAVQQLSSTTDSLPRYRMLSRIGCSNKMIGRSMLAQVMVYFLLPLGLAICHTACVIAVLSKSLFDVMHVSVAEPIALTCVLVLVVYGGYMLMTYLTSKNAVSSALKA